MECSIFVSTLKTNSDAFVQFKPDDIDLSGLEKVVAAQTKTDSKSAQPMHLHAANKERVALPNDIDQVRRFCLRFGHTLRTGCNTGEKLRSVLFRY